MNGDRDYVHVTEFIGSMTQGRATARVVDGDKLEIVHCDGTVTQTIPGGVWVKADIYDIHGDLVETLRAVTEPQTVGSFGSQYEGSVR